MDQNIATMDQNIATMAVELHVVSGTMTAVCASGLGLLMWYIKESIKENRKKDV
ncbi:hypothetical protein TWF730_003690 [Orbilia blumenaviensis]|uniref:Uncharacterized protein n=1 Tax=Orbilia blumenaviensis TaxID=1796055 RepID=A0AAV9U3M1_9PEZI